MIENLLVVVVVVPERISNSESKRKQQTLEFQGTSKECGSLFPLE
jgi:hypothetical protein